MDFNTLSEIAKKFEIKEIDSEKKNLYFSVCSYMTIEEDKENIFYIAEGYVNGELNILIITDKRIFSFGNNYGEIVISIPINKVAKIDYLDFATTSEVTITDGAKAKIFIDIINKKTAGKEITKIINTLKKEQLNKVEKESDKAKNNKN